MNKKPIQSSLKNIKFDELTAEQIVKKYEEVLNSREKQLFELSTEVGQVNQKLENLREKYEKSKLQNSQLKHILEKKEILLKQELDNKEIMFMQLTKKEKESDEFQEKINDFKKNKNNKVSTEKKEKKEQINDDKKKEKQTEKKENVNKDKEEDKKNEKDNNISDPKSMAKEKINQLTNKGEGMKKINVAEMLKKNQEKKNENNS